MELTLKDKKLIEKYKKKVRLESKKIREIKVLEDKTKSKRITIYINIQYKDPKHFKRGKYWEKMYNLAEDQFVDYDKPFYDYFNSNSTNPLYKKEGFEVTKILNQEGGTIVPNIKIEIITQKAVTQRINLA